MNSKKVALVTGGNRGIGKEVVKQLAEQNCIVILSSRDEIKGQKALRDLPEGLKVVYHQLDVTDNDSIERLFEFVQMEFKRLDILVNNAGINYDTKAYAKDVDLDRVRDTMETNLYGPWRMAQRFFPFMQQQDYGRIVNVSSGAGSLAEMTGTKPAYGTSKTALNALTRKLADELSDKNILVNSVCPGWVRTDMGGSNANRSVEEGAKGIVWAALLDDDGPTGGFFRDGEAIAW